MANVPQALSNAAFVSDSAEVLYTSTTAKAVIGAATVRNASSNNVALTIYAVPSAGTAGSGNAIFYRVLPPGYNDVVPELIGHTVEIGASVQAIAGAASSIVLVLSGWEYV